MASWTFQRSAAQPGGTGKMCPCLRSRAGDISGQKACNGFKRGNSNFSQKLQGRGLREQTQCSHTERSYKRPGFGGPALLWLLFPSGGDCTSLSRLCRSRFHCDASLCPHPGQCGLQQLSGASSPLCLTSLIQYLIPPGAPRPSSKALCKEPFVGHRDMIIRWAPRGDSVQAEITERDSGSAPPGPPSCWVWR